MSTKKQISKIKEVVSFYNQWPKLNNPDLNGALLIVDEVLLKNAQFKKWSSQFTLIYPVKSGEQLKTLASFEKHCNAIFQLTQSIKVNSIYSCGGGSVGDFAGFLASVWRRGVSLIQIPSTWLSAIDSAHGGKNALNLVNVKNQIGTFYYPDHVLIIKPLLNGQPQDRIFEALGEIFKIAIINGPTLWKKLERIKLWNTDSLWKILPDLVLAKYVILQADPFEEKGVRQVLNLGHTVGHVFESYFQIPHGFAIAAGLEFALHWSVAEKILKPQAIEDIFMSELWSQWDRLHLKSQVKLLHYENLLQIPIKEFSYLIGFDKKKLGNKINYVFVEDLGKTIIKSVTVQDIVKEIKRQNKFFNEN